MDVFVAAVHRQRDDARAVIKLPDAADRFGTARDRELKVHERDVGPARQELGDGLVAVARLGDDLHVRLDANDLRAAFAHPGGGAHAQDANGAALCCHSFVGLATGCTVVPVPGTLSMRSRPPTRSARSRMVTNPKCSVSWEPLIGARGSKPHPLSAIVSAT